MSYLVEIGSETLAYSQGRHSDRHPWRLCHASSIRKLRDKIGNIAFKDATVSSKSESVPISCKLAGKSSGYELCIYEGSTLMLRQDEAGRPILPVKDKN